MSWYKLIGVSPLSSLSRLRHVSSLTTKWVSLASMGLETMVKMVTIISLWVSGWVNEWVSEWVIERVHEFTDFFQVARVWPAPVDGLSEHAHQELEKEPPRGDALKTARPCSYRECRWIVKLFTNNYHNYDKPHDRLWLHNYIYNKRPSIIMLILLIFN